MKKYDDYEEGKWDWTKYKIIVPTEEDRQELMEAFEHFHYGSDTDTDNVSRFGEVAEPKVKLKNKS